jgi:hypothetical protein
MGTFMVAISILIKGNIFDYISTLIIKKAVFLWPSKRYIRWPRMTAQKTSVEPTRRLFRDCSKKKRTICKNTL